MSYMKIETGIRLEVSGIENKAALLNNEYKKLEFSKCKLETATKYRKQHEEIKELLDAYKLLLQKDMKDIRQFVDEVELLDTHLSKEYSRGAGGKW